MVGQVFPQMISYSLLGIWLIVMVMVTGSTICAYLFLRGRPRGGGPLPPLSILKPLKGLDDGARENFESFFRQDYPEFELLFSVASVNDPALPLVRELQAKYPGVASRIFVGEERIGLNPKVNNLVLSYAAATHDALLISDSNTRVDRDFLLRLGAAFTPEISLLHCAVAGAYGRGPGGQLDLVALNTFYARGTLLAAASGHACVTGKSMLLRKAQLELLGGLKVLSPVIAEDYVAGQLFDAAGLEVRLHSEPIRQYVGRLSLRAFWDRNIRWGRIRKGHAPGFFFFCEPFITSVGSGLAGGFAFLYLGFPPVLFFLLHMGFWALNDMLLMRRLGQKAPWRFLGAWCLRELLHLPLWLHISVGRKVLWRGQQFVLGSEERREARA